MVKSVKKASSAMGTFSRYFTKDNPNDNKAIKNVMSTSLTAENLRHRQSSYPTDTMISRRKILSKSCDELTTCDSESLSTEIDEDVWMCKDKLFQDHIQEVLTKWDQIDDEIWGKIICMEKNRRVAKAYARVPVITVSGSKDGFDGFRIGLSGFDNPLREASTDEAIKSIGSGLKVKIDEEGNIHAKRLSKCNTVIVKEWHTELLEPYTSCLSEEIVNLRGKLEVDKSIKIFDMHKFQKNIAHELRVAYPDRRKLERQCIIPLALVKDASDLLHVPCWVMIINIVALEVLKSKLTPAVIDKRSKPALKSQIDPLLLTSKNVKEDSDSYAPISSSSNSEKKVTIGGQVYHTHQRHYQKHHNHHHHHHRKQRRHELPKKDQMSLKESSKKGKESIKSDTITSSNDSDGKEDMKSGRVEVPTPDYDTGSSSSLSSDSHRKISDPYYSGFSARVPAHSSVQAKPQLREYRGYLNSVLRVLPLQAQTRNDTKRHHSASSSFAMALTDSDDIYGHIYSSISDSKGRLLANRKEKFQVKKPLPTRCN